MLFDSWPQTLRVAIVGLLAYPALVLVLRVSGKRTLSKLNAFDLVVTVALGSTLATTLLSSEVSFVEGVTAMAVLVGAQFAIAASSVRFASARRLAKSAPSWLVRDGRVLDDELQAARVTPSEIRQALRSNGVGDLDEVAAVVLETDGSLSVITRQRAGSRDALADVELPGRTIPGPGSR